MIGVYEAEAVLNKGKLVSECFSLNQEQDSKCVIPYFTEFPRKKYPCERVVGAIPWASAL